MTATPEEVPRPYVHRRCKRCRVEWEDVEANRIVVSPRDTAHFGEDDGMTACGIDATGDGWWWPL